MAVNIQEEKHAWHALRLHSAHGVIRRLADPHGAPRGPRSREPAARGRPAPRHLELPGARLVPSAAVPPAAPARIPPLAHVHRVRRRSGGADARRRHTIRAVAPRDDASMKDVEQQVVSRRRRAEAPRNTVAVKRRALDLGFDAVGVASLEPNAHAADLDRWLAAGYAGTMTYLHRQAEKRKHPARIMPGARAAVVTLTNYFHGSADPGLSPAAGRVAQYAWSADYHRVLGRRLERLATAIREIVPGAKSRCYVDAGPVPERELAQRAGLGWIGKNMMLIDPSRGSFTFIGVVLTDADLAPDLPFEADRCGTCRRCLDACPTAAFVAPPVMDARRCISYLTIEHRAHFTAEERSLVGDWLFGCDVCQEVCPWNVQFARATADPELAPRSDLLAPDPHEFLELDEETFARRYGDTPFERPGAAGMRRNAAAVVANRRRQAP